MNALEVKPKNNALEQMRVFYDGLEAVLNIARLTVISYKTKMFNIFSRSRWRTETLNIEQACVQFVVILFSPSTSSPGKGSE